MLGYYTLDMSLSIIYTSERSPVEDFASLAAPDVGVMPTFGAAGNVKVFNIAATFPFQWYGFEITFQENPIHSISLVVTPLDYCTLPVHLSLLSEVCSKTIPYIDGILAMSESEMFQSLQTPPLLAGALQWLGSVVVWKCFGWYCAAPILCSYPYCLCIGGT